MNAGDRKSCNANKISISVRPPLCHSREGGNPYSTSLRGELASLEDSYPAHAQWIPAFAGMTGWPRATSWESPLTLSASMPVKIMTRGQPPPRIHAAAKACIATKQAGFGSQQRQTQCWLG